MRQDDPAKAKDIHMITPPIIYDGIFDEAKLQTLYTDNGYKPDEVEGYVVRLADEFSYNEFSTCVGKYVTRQFKDKLAASHGHWRESGIKKNG